MNAVSLSVPYIVLSTQLSLNGTSQVHALTPFGHIDISLKCCDSDPPRPLFDISAEGNFDSWIQNSDMAVSFNNSLFILIGKIALFNSNWPVIKNCRLIIRIKDIMKNVTVSGYLHLSDSD